jgi:thymidine kinase
MIKLITGSMFTGKTTWLLEHKNKYYKKNSVMYRPKTDTRDLTTHDGLKYKAKQVESIADLGEAYSDKIKAVYFDEIQFFEKDLGYESFIEQVKLIARVKPVFLAGLDFNFMQMPFAITEYFDKEADEVIRLKTICMGCGKLNHCYSRRNNDNKDIIVIGGRDIYEPVCLGGC